MHFARSQVAKSEMTGECSVAFSSRVSTCVTSSLATFGPREGDSASREPGRGLVMSLNSREEFAMSKEPLGTC